MQLLDLPIRILTYVSVQERQADENKDEMRTKNPQGRFSEGEKRLNLHQRNQVPTKPVENNRERDQVHHTQRTKLPFVQLQP